MSNYRTFLSWIYINIIEINRKLARFYKHLILLLNIKIKKHFTNENSLNINKFEN